MRISNMCAVPGQQILNAVDGGDRHVESVNLRIGGQSIATNQFTAKQSNRFGRAQLCNSIECLKSEFGRYWVTQPGLCKNKLRHHQIVLVTFSLPPLKGDVLVGHGADVVIGPSRQITDN
jgi:hypothetical protein